MTKTKLMTYLYDYRKMCTRMDVLAYRIRRAEVSLDRGSGFIAGTQLGSPQITDMFKLMRNTLLGNIRYLMKMVCGYVNAPV